MVTLAYTDLTDDLGDRVSGTPIDRALLDQRKGVVEEAITDPSNPDVTPGQTTAEVIEARGNLTSLEDRLNGVIDPDGNLILPGSAGTVSSIQSILGSLNLVADDIFLFWSGGDTVAPDHWVKSGTGATIARTGTGLADTTRKVGPYATKLTYGSDTARLTQVLLDAGAFSPADIFKALRFAPGAWVWCSTPGVARTFLYDGVTRTYSDYHAGDSAWAFLAPAATALGGAATQLEVGLELSGAGSAYLSGFSTLLSDVTLGRWVPALYTPGMLKFGYAGGLVVGTKLDVFELTRPTMVRRAVIRCETAPVGSSILVDINTWDGAAFTSMFTGGARPAIPVGAVSRGASSPDGTYARRFLSGVADSAALAAGGALSIDIDQVGSGTAGSDLRGFIYTLQCHRPLEALLAYNDL